MRKKHNYLNNSQVTLLEWISALEQLDGQLSCKYVFSFLLSAEECEEKKMDEAGALPLGAEGGGEPSDADAAIAMAMAATKNSDLNIEIDEDLFDGEDLDIVEEDLETLDLDD